MSNSHTKFGWVSYNGLGDDSIMDRRTDGGDNNIPLKKRGYNKPKSEEVSCFKSLRCGVYHAYKC